MDFDFPRRLRELLEEHSLSQARLADLAGLPSETVNRIVRGTTQNPQLDTLLKIARALHMTVGTLLGEKGFEFSPERRAELRRFVTWGEELLKETQPDDDQLQRSNASAVTLGRRPPQRAPRRGRATPVSATDWRESFGDRREEREVDIPQQFADRDANLVFRADGDSMIGDHIAHGDLLYVREEPDPRNARGLIVVCLVSGSPYVKRLELGAGKIRLVSANERFAPMVFDEDSVDWSLIGIVVGWSHDAR